MIPYLKTLTELLISPQISDIQNQTASSRSMLINQIANTGQKSPEIDTFMKEFEYSYDCPDALFCLRLTGMEKNTPITVLTPRNPISNS